jgi:hypothetical protein
MSAFPIRNCPPVTITLVIAAFPTNGIFHYKILAIAKEFALTEHLEKTSKWRGVPA